VLCAPQVALSPAQVLLDAATMVQLMRFAQSCMAHQIQLRPPAPQPQQQPHQPQQQQPHQQQQAHQPGAGLRELVLRSFARNAVPVPTAVSAFLPLVSVHAPLLIVHVPSRPEFKPQTSELDPDGLAGDLVLCLSKTAFSIRCGLPPHCATVRCCGLLRRGLLRCWSGDRCSQSRAKPVAAIRASLAAPARPARRWPGVSSSWRVSELGHSQPLH
jgi:hypothetical protein